MVEYESEKSIGRLSFRSFKLEAFYFINRCICNSVASVPSVANNSEGD